jgi:hypothetical protein
MRIDGFMRLESTVQRKDTETLPIDAAVSKISYAFSTD